MSNTSKGRALKGSKYWMQTVVQNPILKDALDRKIGDVLHWVSPLADEDYTEYELKQQLELLGLTADEGKKIFSFWPNRQPQWDGLAINLNKTILYIFEAKAHISELNSKISATDANSINKIEDTMNKVYNQYYANGNFELWRDGYYQMANRLTFLHQLQNMHLSNILMVKLVLLNFVNDDTYIKMTEQEWGNHYKHIWKEMLGRQGAPANVLVVNYDVGGIRDKS